MRSDFLKKVLSVFFTKGVLLAVGMVASILAARLLGPSGKGMVGTAAAIGGIGAQFLNFGLHGAGNYALAHDKNCLGGLIGNALTLSAVAFALAMTLYVVLNEIPSLTSIHGHLLLLACACIPVSLYLMLQQNLLIGIGAIRKYNLLEMLNGVLYPLFLLVLMLRRSVKPESVFFSTILAALLSAVAGFCVLLRTEHISARPDWDLFQKCIPFGLKSYAACLCSYLVIRSDILMVGYLLGNEQTGLYSVAVSLTDIIGMLPSAVGSLLFPTASAMTSDRQRSDFMKHTLKTLACAMLLLCAMAALLSHYAVELLYGKAYELSASVLVTLLPGIFFMALQSALSNYFAAKNNWTWNILTPLVGFLSNLLMNLALIPTRGIIGAAIASVISYTIMFLIMLIRFLADNRKIAKEAV